MNAEQLKQAGFSEAEISEWDKLQQAGFSEKEITDHYQQKTPSRIQRLAAFAAPYAPIVGGVAGGIMAAPAAAASAPTGIGPVAAEAGGIAIGTLAGKEFERGLREYAGKAKPPATIGEAFRMTAGAIPEAVQAGLLGPIGSKVIPAATGAIGAGVRAGREAFRGAGRAATEAAETGISKAVGAVKEAPSMGLEAVKGFVKGAREGLSNAEVTKTARDILFAVRKGLNKGVGARWGGTKANPAMIQKAEQDAAHGISEIIRRRGGLALGEEGAEVAGRLPESVSDYVQAIQQTEKSIFKGYDQLQKAAGEAGVVVDQSPVAGRLVEIAKQSTSKEIKDYAIQRAREYAPVIGAREIGVPGGPLKWTPEQAQDAIANYNRSLRAWMENPGYDTASKAYVDGEIAKAERQLLDEAITKSEGPGYQELKNSWGAVKSLEKDAVAQFKRMARQVGSKELVNVTDIYSIGEILTGLSTGHPLMIAKGSAFAAAKKAMQAYWSPDRYIKGMFKTVDELMFPPAPAPGTKTGALRTKTGIAATEIGAELTDEKMEEKIRAWLDANSK